MLTMRLQCVTHNAEEMADLMEWVSARLRSGAKDSSESTTTSMCKFELEGHEIDRYQIMKSDLSMLKSEGGDGSETAVFVAYDEAFDMAEKDDTIVGLRIDGVMVNLFPMRGKESVVGDLKVQPADGEITC